MGHKKTIYVWVLTSEFGPSLIGGLGTVATELTHSLTALNVRVKVWNKGASSAISHSISRIRKSALPDIIHIHSLEYALLALQLKKQYQIPVLYTCHSLVAIERNSNKQRRRSNLQGRLIRQANLVIAPSHWLKNQIIRRYPVLSSKIKVIPNGVAMTTSRSHHPTYKLLFVGRLIKDKGIEPLIRSLSLLSRMNSKVRLTVVGRGSLHYQSRLKAIARHERVANKIRWVGFIPHNQMHKLYASQGAVVIPSRQESFGLVALEAMAQGVPIVSTRAGGLREFVERSHAQIISGTNRYAIARAITNMWRQPSLTKMRAKRAKNAAESYRWIRIAMRYKQAMLKLSRTKRSEKR